MKMTHWNMRNKLVIVANQVQYDTFFQTRKSTLNADIVEDIADICDVILDDQGDAWLVEYLPSLPYTTVVVIPRTQRWGQHIALTKYALEFGSSCPHYLDVHMQNNKDAISRSVSQWRDGR